MKFSLQQIAGLLGGNVEGDASVEVWKLAKIDEEAETGSICFLANMKYENYVYQTKATAVIVGKDFIPKKEIKTNLIRVDNPYSAFTVLLETYDKLINEQKLQKKIGIEQPSFIGNDTLQGKNIYIGAFAYIGSQCILGDNVKIYPHTFIGDNVKIGANSVIYAGAKIYENTEIGQNCTINAGAVIGCEGFGFAPQADGTYRNIPQLGKVILEDNVSIGANTTIDRATMGNTLIQEGTKLDNLIQVAHNVVIGKNTVIAAQAGISGSAKIGDNCMIGGQVGISGHLEIVENTKIGAQAGIAASITKPGSVVIGAPAFNYRDFMKSYVVFRKLPELQKQLDEVAEKVITLLTDSEEKS
jgi:UDP-3-O-[3-hydroxymyristoyl] glucosamine N-acyltransferase